MNVIADIAGEFSTLIKLLKKMPKDRTLFLGDMIDRGNENRKVLNLVKKNKNFESLMGNHEHMMINHVLKSKVYAPYVWIYNGGNRTLLEYYKKDKLNTKGLNKDVEFLKTLSLYKEFKEKDGSKFFFSHAPLADGLDIEEASNIDTDFYSSLIWNRSPKIKDIEGTTQIFGHNSHWGLKKFKRDDGSLYALCLDQSKKSILTGYNTKTKKIYMEPYLGISK